MLYMNFFYQQFIVYTMVFHKRLHFFPQLIKTLLTSF